MTEITVAALQLAFTSDLDANIAHVSELVREAAGKGAQVILPTNCSRANISAGSRMKDCSRTPSR